jgi:hypothetical protein
VSVFGEIWFDGDLFIAVLDYDFIWDAIKIKLEIWRVQFDDQIRDSLLQRSEK